MSPAELFAVIGVTFSIAVVVVLKLSKPTIINNYAPKAEASAHADGGGASSGSPGSSLGGLVVKLGLLGVLLAVALTVISAITGIATTATNAISDAARPVVVQEAPAAPPPVEVPAPVPAPVTAPVPAPVSVPAVATSPVDLFGDFIAAGGWIPVALIVALILTRPRGRATSEPETIYYPPRTVTAPRQKAPARHGERGIPIENVPLFSDRERIRK